MCLDACFNNQPVIGEKVIDREFEVYHKNKFTKTKLSKLYKDKWVVLFFYPADFTFVCPTELEDLAEAYAKLKKMGVEVVSVSTDTVFTHKAWQDASETIAKVKFPMAADPTGQLCRDFGVYIQEEGLALRGTFIINSKGELKAMEVHDNNIGRDADELIRKIQAAQFVETNKGQVCPAKWKPGNKTLKPGIKLVGKI
ncbi:MAG: peroxiredoxin [Candidatus Moraniibacteriota bacterium]|nr:MAG: peroxiredoxin [Candidatus Moranbacteria bacterium]